MTRPELVAASDSAGPVLVGAGALAGALWLSRRRSGPARGRVTPTPGIPRKAQRAQLAGGEALIAAWAPPPLVDEDPETGQRKVAPQLGISDRARLPGTRIARIDCPRPGAVEVHLDLAATGLTLAEVRSRTGSLESLLRLPPGSVEAAHDRRDAGRVVLRWAAGTAALVDQSIPWPGLPTRPPSILDPCLVGYFPDGTPVEVVLAFVHVMVTGTTGAGKSWLLNVLVAWYAACRDVVLWGIDQKGGAELGPWEPVLGRPMATTVEQAEPLLEDAARLAEGRARIMRERGWRKWKPTPSNPVLVILIDEHADLGGSQRCIDALKTITAKGRACGVWVVTGLQKATMGAFGTRTDETANLIPNNITCRFCGLVATASEARVALGEGAGAEGWHPENITGGPGTWLLRHLPEHREPRTWRALAILDDQVDAAAAALGAAQPGLDPQSTAAAGLTPVLVSPGPGPAVLTRPTGQPRHRTTGPGSEPGSDWTSQPGPSPVDWAGLAGEVAGLRFDLDRPGPSWDWAAGPNGEAWPRPTPRGGPSPAWWELSLTLDQLRSDLDRAQAGEAAEPEPDPGPADPVMAALAAAGEHGIHYQDLAEQIGVHQATAYRRLGRLRDADPPLAEALGDGRWRAAGHSHSQPEGAEPRARARIDGPGGAANGAANANANGSATPAPIDELRDDWGREVGPPDPPA